MAHVIERKLRVACVGWRVSDECDLFASAGATRCTDRLLMEKLPQRLTLEHELPKHVEDLTA